MPPAPCGHRSANTARTTAPYPANRTRNTTSCRPARALALAALFGMLSPALTAWSAVGAEPQTRHGQPPAEVRQCQVRPLNILLTNDDGYDTPGIIALHRALAAAGHAVRRIAPETNQSGGSASLSIRPVTVTPKGNADFPHVYAADATPATTVLLGQALFADQAVDLIVSGINAGANLGPATPISGTVGATIAGLQLLNPPVPGIAVSTDPLVTDPEHPDNLAHAAGIADFTARLIERLQQRHCGAHPVLPPNVALNVNYPPRAPEALRGVRWASQGASGSFALAFERAADGRFVPRMSPVPDALPDPAGDTSLYAEGFVTIVPIDGDYTATQETLTGDDLGGLVTSSDSSSVSSSASSLTPSVLAYPETKQIPVTLDYHGTPITDPYQWLESLDDPAVGAWVEAQNRVTRDHLRGLPLQTHFNARLTELWDFSRTGLPQIEAGQLFYSQNAGLERQAPIYRRSGSGGAPTLVLDPNAISADGAVSLASWSPAPDGQHLAYGLAEGGADWRTLRVRNLSTGQDLGDRVAWVRFSGIAWTRDGKGFFYSRYPEPPANKALEAALNHHAVWYHRIGTPQSEDIQIYARPDLPSWVMGAAVTEDGRYLLIMMSEGAGNRNRLYYADLGDPLKPRVSAPVRALIETDDAEYAPIGSVGSTLYLRTDRGSPNRRVVALTLDSARKSASSEDLRTVVPERREALESVSLIGGKLVAQYLVDAQSRLELIELDGTSLGPIPLPETGTVSAINGRGDTPELWYLFSSPLAPATVYRHDLQTGRSTPFEAPDVDFDVSPYVTTAGFATAPDGTKIPYFMTARRDLPRNGSHPTMLYGYGGFSISILPTWRTDVLAWLELGGVWVTASLRGGAEYGEAWHEAGMLARKQTVFDDFVAVAEHLVRERVTRPDRLGIMGGSNGGLLVGAVMNQRPDLFAVGLPAVGVMDMLRFDRFTGGRLWVSEYGSATNPDQFPILRAYSPLHNLRTGTCYPATLVITADHDDRVVPSHSYKYAAALQAAQGCARPTLIRVETSGSHGYSPTDKLIAERADQWAFAAAAVGLSPALETTGGSGGNGKRDGKP